MGFIPERPMMMMMIRVIEVLCFIILLLADTAAGPLDAPM